jgi:hypothetical protein
VTTVEYVAPPKPEKPEGVVIEIPEDQGESVTVITHENGMTSYLHREPWDWDAADRYVQAIQEWMNDNPDEWFIGLPVAQHPEEHCWFGRDTLEKAFHIRDAVVQSPLAVPRTSRQRQIVVPMGDGVARIPQHGEGKRRR